jgi:hypothetical protein
MELGGHFRLAGIHARVSGRISALWRNARSRAGAHPLSRHSKRVTGALLALLALAMGSWAESRAATSSLNGWLKSHPPEPAAWLAAVSARGYREVTLANEASLFHKAAHALPVQLDSDSSVWVADPADSQADLWLAVFARGETQNEAGFRLYCLDCAAAPKAWARLGVGWSAFDPALQAASRGQARLASLKRTNKPKKQPVPRDPREILY